jgi:DNA-binding CsgD family transcriptional regulator
MSTQRRPLDVGVSAREAKVLSAVAEHLTNAEIAARLFISIRTVESYVSSLLRKFQVEDRTKRPPHGAGRGSNQYARVTNASRETNDHQSNAGVEPDHDVTETKSAPTRELALRIAALSGYQSLP